jgi:DNA repair exonuclease SbcCD ATPase subunit
MFQPKILIRSNFQNAELSRLIEEMRPVLEEASKQEERFQKKEREYATQLSEKNQQVDELLAKVKQLEEQVAAAPVPKPVTNARRTRRDGATNWSKKAPSSHKSGVGSTRSADSFTMMKNRLRKQMRDMEVSMARERAMMARQETELKRLSAEIQHELEMLQRGDGTLREQLSRFQRRHQEVLSRGAGGSPMAQPSEPATAPVAATVTPPVQKDSGLFGRIFRGGK